MKFDYTHKYMRFYSITNMKLQNKSRKCETETFEHKEIEKR